MFNFDIYESLSALLPNFKFKPSCFIRRKLTESYDATLQFDFSPRSVRT